MVSNQLLSNSGKAALMLTLKLLSSKTFWYGVFMLVSTYLVFAPPAQKWSRADTAKAYWGLLMTLPAAIWLSKDVEYGVTSLSVHRRVAHQFEVDGMAADLNRIRAGYQRELELITGRAASPDGVMADQLAFLTDAQAIASLPGDEQVTPITSPVTAALARYGVKTQEIGQQQTPYFTRHVLELMPDGKGKPPKVADVEQLSREIQIGLKAEDEPLISVTRDGLLVDVPLPKDQRKAIAAELHIKPGMQTHTDDFAVSLGIGIDGKLYCLNFSDPATPHALVGGTTGSGKTEFLRTLLYSVVSWYAPDVAMLAIADPKRVSFNDFANHSGMIAPVAKNPDDTLVLVESLVGEMERRYELFENADVVDVKQFNANNPTPLARIMFLLDEYSEMADQCSDEQFKKIETALRRLTQKARAAGIHVVIATQKPIAKSSTSPRGLDTVLRANLPAAIALKVRNSNDSAVVLGEPGAEKLLGKGDMLALVGPNSERYQAPLITQKQSIQQAIARHGLSNSFVQPATPQPPKPQQNSQIVDVDYRQIFENSLLLDGSKSHPQPDLESFFSVPENESIFDKRDRDEWLEALCKYLKQKRAITVRNLKKGWGSNKGFSSAEVDDLLTTLEQMGMIAVSDGGITYEGT